MDYMPGYGAVSGYTSNPITGIVPTSPWINGNPAIALKGSIVDAHAIDYPMREIVYAEVAAGLVPTNDDLTQLTQAIKLLGRIPYCVDQGTANHLVVNPIPGITRYQVPIILAIQVAYANTGACDINVSGLGPIPLTRTNGVQMVPNDLVANGDILVAYDGTKFQMLSVPGSLGFPLPQQLDHYGVDTSLTPNTITATVDFIGATAWPTGLFVAILVKNANTGPTTVVLNGLPGVPLKRGTAGALQSGDVNAGYIALMIYDGN